MSVTTSKNSNYGTPELDPLICGVVTFFERKKVSYSLAVLEIEGKLLEWRDVCEEQVAFFHNFA